MKTTPAIAAPAAPAVSLAATLRELLDAHNLASRQYGEAVAAGRAAQAELRAAELEERAAFGDGRAFAAVARQAAARAGVEQCAAALLEAEAEMERLSREIHPTWTRYDLDIDPAIGAAERRAEAALRTAAAQVARAARDLNAVRFVRYAYTRVYARPKINDPDDPTLNLGDATGLVEADAAEPFGEYETLRKRVDGVPKPRQPSRRSA